MRGIWLHTWYISQVLSQSHLHGSGAIGIFWTLSFYLIRLALNLCRQRKYFLYKLSWGRWIDFADETLHVILLVSIYWVSQTYRSSVLEILTRNSALYQFRSSSAWHIMIQTWLAKELCNNRNTVRYCFKSKSDFLLVCNSIHDTKFLHKRNSVLK